MNEWQKLAAYIHSIRVTIRIKLEDKLLRLVSYHCINKVVRQTEWYAFWTIKCFTLSNINFIIKFFLFKYTNEIFTKKKTKSSEADTHSYERATLSMRER